jgi:serine/threonine protein kinase
VKAAAERSAAAEAERQRVEEEKKMKGEPMVKLFARTPKKKIPVPRVVSSDEEPEPEVPVVLLTEDNLEGLHRTAQEGSGSPDKYKVEGQDEALEAAKALAGFRRLKREFKIGKAVDMWALGCIIYNMITGKTF